jgi:hypothetical protein
MNTNEYSGGRKARLPDPIPDPTECTYCGRLLGAGAIYLGDPDHAAAFCSQACVDAHDLEWQISLPRGMNTITPARIRREAKREARP